MHVRKHSKEALKSVSYRNDVDRSSLKQDDPQTKCPQTGAHVSAALNGNMRLKPNPKGPCSYIGYMVGTWALK